MEIEERVRKRFGELISSGNQLKHGDEFDQALNDEQHDSCAAWLISAQNVAHFVVSNPNSPYRTAIDRICTEDRKNYICRHVGEVNAILQSLLQDIDSGLLESIENQTKAAVFDDFLDHAKEYAKAKRPNEAGVIAGVVFEDTLRTICRNRNIEETDKKLDSLINELVKDGSLSQVKAKRARVAAGVRTKATHAQWEEFDLEDVKTTIEFTDELILKYLEK